MTPRAKRDKLWSETRRCSRWTTSLSTSITSIKCYSRLKETSGCMNATKPSRGNKTEQSWPKLTMPKNACSKNNSFSIKEWQCSNAWKWTQKPDSSSSSKRNRSSLQTKLLREIALKAVGLISLSSTESKKAAWRWALLNTLTVTWRSSNHFWTGPLK